MKRILTYLLIVPILALTACEPRTDDDLATTDNDSLAMAQDARFAQGEMQSWLDEIDRNFEQLQTRAQEAGENADFDIEDLRQRRDEIRTDIQEMGNQTDSWTADLGSDLQSRLRDLDSDVEEARLKSIEQRDEFITEVRTRLNEIDSELESLGRRAGDTAAGTQGTAGTGTAGTGTAGTGTGTDAGMGMDNQTTADANNTQQRNDAYGTTGNTYSDVDVENLRSDRDDIAEQLQELESNGDTEFESAREDLAESVADLRARVQEASLRGTDNSMQTNPNAAAMN